MNTMHTLASTGALAAAIVLVAAPSAGAQDRPGQQQERNPRSQQRQDDPREQRQTQRFQPQFVEAETALDAAVVNRNRNELADVEDLIVDLHRKQAAYAVLKADGRTIAIPYAVMSWSWNPGEQEGRYTLDATPEQLKTVPEFDTTRLGQLRDESWKSTLRGIFGWVPGVDDEDRPERGADPYARLFRDGETINVEGTVTAVDRTSHRGEEVVIITLDEGQARAGDRNREPGRRAESGETGRLVLLGPTWYVMHQPQAPSIGEKLRVKGVEARGAEPGQDRGPTGRMIVAMSIEGPDGELALREKDGSGIWQSTETPGKPERSMDRQMSRHALLTKLDDGDVITPDGEDFGSVKTIVLEANSGTAAFATVSVGGVLGIAGTTYAIPLDQLRYDEQEQNLHVNMRKDKLELAPKLSDRGIEDLNDATYLERLYTYYGMKPVDFQSKAHQRKWSPAERTGGWAGDTDLQRLWGTGDDVEIDGTVRGTKDQVPMGEMSEGTYILVETDEGLENVLVGPAWFVESQNLALKRDAEIHVEGRKVEINGRPVILARMIEIDGRRCELRNEQGQPRWNAGKGG